ncbi:MAG TPA: SRPBCC family protein, partial [Propylenella sp.]|nr:SRPBCC family protein [Propylenella sp.]
MASLRKEISTRAHPDDVWAAIRDVGELHTRLVPGFVVDTRLEPGARIVTFANGMVIREPIVSIDDAARRLVWAAEGGPMTHYNASAEVLAGSDATTVVWRADFLPDKATDFIRAAMDEGAAAMKAALDRLAALAPPDNAV